ncbi:41867_t:CDS:2, partial [Gigaspora margarita]
IVPANQITNSDHKIIQVTWETKFETRQSRPTWKRKHKEGSGRSNWADKLWNKVCHGKDAGVYSKNLQANGWPIDTRLYRTAGWQSTEYRESTKKYEKAALSSEESRKEYGNKL